MSYLKCFSGQAGPKSSTNDDQGAAPRDGSAQGSAFPGPTDGDYLIVVTWDSKEQSEAFTKNTVLPALPVDRGFVGAPEQRTAEVTYDESAWPVRGVAPFGWRQASPR